MEVSMRKIAVTPEILEMLRYGAPVVFSSSGGKDSTVLVLDGHEFLDSIGHTGPRIISHADLGRVEWKQSMEVCERLAEYTGMKLVVVRREKGDMMDRWWQRQADNLDRYINLKLVQVLLPWSTPGMRFCTSEMKEAPIGSDIIRRFGYNGIGPERYPTVISATGIRREESTRRAKSKVFKPWGKGTRRTWKIRTYSWLLILDYLKADVYESARRHGFALHDGYERFHMERISCAFCIMASLSDLLNSASNPEHWPIYREMVDLEIESTFSFQSGRWLGDVKPEVLSLDQRAMLFVAKRKAERREAAESRIPRHLLYEAGWPTLMPTPEEAEILASVRREVAEILGIEVLYTTGAEVLARYEELMAEREARDGGVLVQIGEPQLTLFC
jgi:3'-phosphoadenosine 5'-phosphosulfate sulfotransferase (PAPS reductase)/FAD synthetase